MIVQIDDNDYCRSTAGSRRKPVDPATVDMSHSIWSKKYRTTNRKKQTTPDDSDDDTTATATL